jgi:hypothetical protein
MKRTIYLFTMIFALTSTGFGQSKSYVTSGAEFIFSFADIQQSAGPASTILRFAPVINLQSMINRDVSKNFGVFSGLAVRNVGYRMEGYKDPTDNLVYRKAFRSYNLGVPVGIKIGKMNNLFFYGGYELEMAVLYKEKTYEHGDKINKVTGWFSDRENIWQSSIMVGVQFPYAANLKFKYYLTEFHNQNYTNSNGVKLYSGLQSHVFYVSLSFFLFRNAHIYYYNES